MNPIRKPHHVRRPLVALTTAALALTVTLGACGRDEGGDAAEGQGEAISDGEASGTIEVWAMGTEGDVLGDFASDFADANPDADADEYGDADRHPHEYTDHDADADQHPHHHADANQYRDADAGPLHADRSQEWHRQRRGDQRRLPDRVRRRLL